MKTLTTATQDYLNYGQTHWANNTIVAYTQKMEWWNSFLGAMPLAKITPDHIICARTELQQFRGKLLGVTTETVEPRSRPL